MKNLWTRTSHLIALLLLFGCEQEVFLPDQLRPTPTADLSATEVNLRHDATTPTSTAERQALVDFYEALESTGELIWPVEDTSNDPCMDRWPGVTCEEGKVIKLELEGYYLSGPISGELGGLPALQYLYLGGNRLNGSIPPELGSLSNLRELTLFNNPLTGSIPLELGKLEDLEILALGSNRLTGSIPPELGRLANLRHLALYDNQFTGAIPPELGSLENLRYLFLYFNQLTGTIPKELGKLENLEFLLLGDNQLTGSIPPELGRLANLQRLEIYWNRLTGPLPPELGNLSKLKQLLLRRNQITGIPKDLGNLAELKQLDLFSNELKGTIPRELGRLTKLEELSLSDNQISGSIPSELANLIELNVLLLNNNQLTCYESALKLLYDNNPSVQVYTRDNPGPDGNGLPSWEDFITTGAGTCPLSPDVPIEDMECRLIDAKKHQAMGIIADGDVLNQADFPLKVSIAVQFPVEVEATRLELIGPSLSVERKESEQPYSIFGDRGGIYKGRFLPQGNYTLRVTPIVEGISSPPLTRHFKVVGPTTAINAFTLLDADNHVELGPLSDGDRLLSSVPLAIRAEPTTSEISSVRFQLEGPLSIQQMENTPPYSLFGNKGDDYFGRSLPNGTYTLTATPYPRRNGFGQAGQSYSVSFTVGGFEDL